MCNQKDGRVRLSVSVRMLTLAVMAAGLAGIAVAYTTERVDTGRVVLTLSILPVILGGFILIISPLTRRLERVEEKLRISDEDKTVAFIEGRRF
jgi:hypothetical protein